MATRLCRPSPRLSWAGTRLGRSASREPGTEIPAVWTRPVRTPGTVTPVRSARWPAGSRPDRTGHAPRAASQAAQLTARYPDYSHPGRLEPGIGLEAPLVADYQASPDGQHVAPVVCSARLTPDRIHARVEHVKPADAHGLSRCLQEWLRPRHAHPIAVGRNRVRGHRVSDAGVHEHQVDVDDSAQGVKVAVTTILADGHSEHRMSETCIKQPAGKALVPAGVVRLPTPMATTPGASSSTSPPSTCSRAE